VKLKCRREKRRKERRGRLGGEQARGGSGEKSASDAWPAFLL